MRKEVTFTIQDNNNELTIVCTQMSAFALERWVTKLATLILGTGIAKTFDIDSISNSASALNEIAKIVLSDGLTSLASIDEAKYQELHDQLLETCSLVRDNMKLKLTQNTIEGNIENFTTIFKILKKALEINLNFSFGEWMSLSGSKTHQSAPQKQKISVRS